METKFIRFTVPGKPGAKGRPRFTRTGKTYTPKETASYENLVRLEYQGQAKGFSFSDDTCLFMEIFAFYPIPKSTSKKKREGMLNRLIRPAKKPDVDNVMKIIADSLNGIAYRDDSQIVEAMVCKYYSEEPKVIVELRECRCEKG